jgi:uncharacterized protein YutE (UPF0331/DUF86 family)
MAIQSETIKNLLQQLDEYLSLIENMSIGSEEEILENKDIQHLLERRLHIALEIAIDISAHIAAGLKLPDRETAKSVFAVLGKEGIISKQLALKMQDVVGFRNILVHEYGEIDHSLVYKTYKEDLGDLHRFGSEIIEFLEEETA